MRRVGQATAREVRVYQRPQHLAAPRAPGDVARGREALGRDLPSLQDHRPLHVGGPTVAVVQLERPVREQQRAHLDPVSHVSALIAAGISAGV